MTEGTPDPVPKRRRPRWWRWGRWALLAVGLGAVLVSVPAIWVRMTSGPYLRTTADVPDAPVAIVLGAKVTGDSPSPFLAGRLDVAADLYKKGKVHAILVSGDNGSRGYDEPTAMRRYLTEHGVPERVVVSDYAGFDTWDTCSRAKRIFGVDKATVVTQDFHVPRAVALCRSLGIDAYGVGHDSTAMSEDKTRYGEVREFFAASKAMWDAVITKPDPRFLGPHESGVADALSQH